MIETTCFVDPRRNRSILGKSWAMDFDSGVFCGSQRWTFRVFREKATAEQQKAYLARGRFFS